MMDKISTEGSEKAYALKGGRATALAQVDLTIQPNEFVAPAGASGRGKSAPFKLIGGLIRPSHGLVLHDGVALILPPRDVDIVFQEAVLLEWRSVLDYVRRRRRLGRRRVRPCTFSPSSALPSSRAVSRVICRRHAPAGSIRRALVHKPSVLLMDEPYRPWMR